MEMDKSIYYPQVYLGEFSYEIKQTNIVRFIDAKLELDDSDSFHLA